MLKLNWKSDKKYPNHLLKLFLSTNSNNNIKRVFNHFKTPVKYFLVSLCTFVKFLAFSPNLIPKYLLDGFVNLKISQSSVRRHLASIKLKGDQQISSNSKANTEELVQTVTGCYLQFPLGVSHWVKALLSILGDFFNQQGWFTSVNYCRCLAFTLSDWEQTRQGSISGN